MRGFHGSISSANAIMKGFEIWITAWFVPLVFAVIQIENCVGYSLFCTQFFVYYNFIRKHQAINKCPYELATDLNLTQNNKWLELIKLSMTNLIIK